MNRFTIITVVIAVSIITVTADLVVREYLNKTGKTSLLDLLVDNSTPSPESNVGTTSDVGNKSPSDSSIYVPPIQPKILVTAEPSPLDRALISKAGFGQGVNEKPFDGKVFQLLDITAQPVSGMSLYEVAVEQIPVASINEIALADEIRSLQLYLLLQNKTKPYIDLSLNENNSFGDRSFYVNHAKKTDEAFLVVMIGKRVYAFAYLKLYHPQVKELVALLTK